jgi:hypothetical protein
VLNNPAFSKYYIQYGEISTYPGGYKENAGIFTHNNAWIICAEAYAGRGDKAFEYYSKIAPAFNEDISDLHKNYNDWWYAILAYCNSPSSLNQVLVHEGSNPSLWDFYEKKLMPDAHVIADFIAYVYLANEDSLTYSSVVDYEETTVAETSSDKAGQAIDKDDPSIRKYKIRKGDTLTKIAAMYHVSISDLVEWNNLSDDKILEGQILIIKK